MLQDNRSQHFQEKNLFFEATSHTFSKNFCIRYKYRSIKDIGDEKTHLPLKGEGRGERAEFSLFFDGSKIFWALQPPSISRGLLEHHKRNSAGQLKAHSAQEMRERIYR